MKTKRKLLLLAGAAGLALFGSSCHYPYGGGPYTGTGAVAGGLIGAGVGTIVGSQSDRPLEGAAIGGAIGAIGGAVLGSSYHRGGGYYRGGGYRYGGGYRGGYGGGHCSPPPCHYGGGGYHRY
jgi:hypothetical protein